MRLLIVATAFLALASARPEPPSGYTYNIPSQPLEYPSGGASIDSSNVGLLLDSGAGGHSYTLAHSSGSGALSHGYALSSGLSSSGLSSSGLGLLTSGGLGSSLGGASLLLTQQAPPSAVSFASGGFSGSSGGAVVKKHIYVHVPPPEPEEYRPQRVYPVAPPQKHYKIIFIKAPTPPTPTVPSIPVQPQNEEKTLVYVLVKKPEEQPEIHIPQPIPTQPTKPEVYFIRYKTHKQNDLGGSILSSGISDASGIGSSSISGSSLIGSSISTSSLEDGLSGLHLSSGLAGSSISSSSVSSSLSSSYGVPSASYGPPKLEHKK
ncbi:hypothetical protein HHI36_020739 [Cryptolaemus montrouzieri]|uniref:DUF243 domain-containing protein n=1 Tax=Cryptolaemus montrouzieri TaxID=559131 RepID=A0ABD2NBL5_9CUCU